MEKFKTVIIYCAALCWAAFCMIACGKYFEKRTSDVPRFYVDSDMDVCSNADFTYHLTAAPKGGYWKSETLAIKGDSIVFNNPVAGDHIVTYYLEYGDSVYTAEQRIRVIEVPAVDIEDVSLSKDDSPFDLSSNVPMFSQRRIEFPEKPEALVGDSLNLKMLEPGIYPVYYMVTDINGCETQLHSSIEVR